MASELTEERIREYMKERLSEKVGNRTINLELEVLARAFGRTAGAMWPDLRRLEQNHDVGRALSPEEEQKIVETATRNRSHMIGPAVRIALATGMRRDEIRLLTWEQIDLLHRRITVGRAKTSAGRGRSIPFGERLAAVLADYRNWYQGKLGTIKPEWYVFPKCNRTRPTDPTEPLGSFARAWNSVRTDAGVKCRFHDLRHTVCTKMAEAGVPEATMKAILGHMSRAMLERYSHIRQQSKIEAMEAVEARSFFLPLQESPKVAKNDASESSVTH